MNRILRYLSFVLLSVLGFYSFFACNSTRVVRPLQAKEWNVGGSLGGPIINFAGAKIPVPFTSLYGAYGINNSLTGFAGLHTTSAMFGNAQVDFGVTKGLLTPSKWRPGVSISPIGNFLLTTQGGVAARFYPQIDLNAYWEYGQKKHYAYIGMNNWFNLSSKKAFDVKNDHYFIPNFTIGNRFNRPKMSYSIEVKLLAPFSRNDYTVVEYNGIGNKGAIGVYFGISRSLFCKAK